MQTAVVWYMVQVVQGSTEASTEHSGPYDVRLSRCGGASSDGTSDSTRVKELDVSCTLPLKAKALDKELFPFVLSLLS